MATKVLDVLNEPMRMRKKGLLNTGSFDAPGFGDSYLAWYNFLNREIYKKNPEAGFFEADVSFNSTANQDTYVCSAIASDLVSPEYISIIRHRNNYVIDEKDRRLYEHYYNPKDNLRLTTPRKGDPEIWFPYKDKVIFYPSWAVTQTAAATIFYSKAFNTDITKSSTDLNSAILIPDHNKNIVISALLLALDDLLPIGSPEMVAQLREMLRQQSLETQFRHKGQKRLEIATEVRDVMGGLY